MKYLLVCLCGSFCKKSREKGRCHPVEQRLGRASSPASAGVSVLSGDPTVAPWATGFEFGLETQHWLFWISNLNKMAIVGFVGFKDLTGQSLTHLFLCICVFYWFVSQVGHD